MDYLGSEPQQNKRWRFWRSLSIGLTSIVFFLSLELFYLLTKLSDLDIVNLGLGICQALTLLVFHGIIAIAIWKQHKTLLLGVTVISLVFNIGYFIFYCLLELSSVFQVYQGNTSLQPAHPLSWYRIQQLFSTSLVVQELLAIICCIVCFKVRSLIPEISEPTIMSANLRSETISHGLLTAAVTPKRDSESKIVYIENTEGFSSKVYTYGMPKEESFSEISYGNHQANSYMKDASKIRSAKAKLDKFSLDSSSM